MFLLSIIIVDFIIQFKFAVTYSIFKPITPLLMGYQPLCLIKQYGCHVTFLFLHLGLPFSQKRFFLC